MKITRTLLVFMAGATMADTMDANSLKEAESPVTETVTLAVNPRPTYAGATVAPSSQLTREQALALASALAKVSGRDIIVAAVGPTGSMRPYFDENALLLLEAAPFGELRLGDVVTFFHPRLHVEVVHRLLEKRGDAFWSKGDHNNWMDDVLVTPENYHRRLVGVIYFQPGTAQPSDAALTAAVRNPPKMPSRAHR
jgi:signal peptidase I